MQYLSFPLICLVRLTGNSFCIGFLLTFQVKGIILQDKYMPRLPCIPFLSSHLDEWYGTGNGEAYPEKSPQCT